MIQFLLIVISVTCLFQQKIYAWGALAHRASAEIAWNVLDLDTKKKVNAILQNEDFIQSSTWADSARGNPEWKFSIWYHFEKAPDNYTYLDNLKRQDPKTHQLGGLIEALFVAENMLLKPQTSVEEKSIALKFIIHLVSDIHQPLHTGRVEDNSGNKIPVQWLGQTMNLHQVWDSQIIALGHKDILDPQDYKKSASLYAEYLLKKNRHFIPEDRLFLKYDDWMHESMVPRAEAYLYKDESEDKYTQRFLNTVDDRVFISGIRIAHVIHRLLQKEEQTTPMIQLKNAIISIVGDFYNFVSLKPRFVTN